MGEARAARGDRNNAAFDENFLAVGEGGHIFAVERDVACVGTCGFRPFGEIGFEARDRSFYGGFKIDEIMR